MVTNVSRPAHKREGGLGSKYPLWVYFIPFTVIAVGGGVWFWFETPADSPLLAKLVTFLLGTMTACAVSGSIALILAFLKYGREMYPNE